VIKNDHHEPCILTFDIYYLLFTFVHLLLLEVRQEHLMYVNSWWWGVCVGYATASMLSQVCWWWVWHAWNQSCSVGRQSVSCCWVSKGKITLYSIDECWAWSWSQSLGSQPAGDFFINSMVGCHYFVPSRQFPFQLKSITAAWPVPYYTDCDRGIQV